MWRGERESSNQGRNQNESPKAYLCQIATEHDDLECLCLSETLKDDEHVLKKLS